MIAHELLPLLDGVRIAVPCDRDLLTPYVLREQLDWFEDEIGFARALARPGMNIVDVGANYGVYALAMGARIGPGGRLWAFEPARATAAFLRASVAVNNLESISVIEAGLSNRSGEATLHTEPNAEMNTLNPSGAGSTNAETVRIRSLDECANEFGIERVAFVKLDAEGEEARILEGARAFLRTNDPLCMLEIKHGTHVNRSLVEAFVQLGFDLYRLQPGLGALVPFPRNAPLDPFQLNLFAATPARAARLAAMGLLVETLPSADALPSVDPRVTIDRLHGLPYAHGLPWRTATTPLSAALGRYVQSQTPTLPLPLRACALNAAMGELATALSMPPTPTTLMTVARVALAVGQRMLAVHALDQALARLLSSATVAPDEPFLAPDAWFDTVSTGESLDRWSTAAVVAQIERRSHYSSFYTAEASLPRLRVFRDLGYPCPEMARRLDLVEARAARRGGSPHPAA